MTLDLQDAIIAKLKEVVQNLRLDNESLDDIVIPQVFDGWLPEKRSTENDDFPYVIVRPSKGGGIDAETVSVNIMVGVVSEDSNGYRYAVQVKDHIKIAFLQNQILDSRFRIVKFDWKLPDVQPKVFWELEINTEWQVPRVEQLDEEGELL